MTVVLDSGALIAYERGARLVGMLLDDAARRGEEVAVPASVEAQVFRDPARQVRLVRLLGGCNIVPLDDLQARAIGMLLARAGATDVVDASVVLAAADGDTVLTSDPDDLAALLDAAKVTVELVAI